MKTLFCCGLAVVGLSASAGAQGRKMDTMKSEMSYTGCLERSPEGAITLTHAMASDGAAKKAMSKGDMAHDSMVLTLSSTKVDLTKHVGHKVAVKGVSDEQMGGTAPLAVTSMKMVASSCS